jgi:hypothetical protein
LRRQCAGRSALGVEKAKPRGQELRAAESAVAVGIAVGITVAIGITVAVGITVEANAAALAAGTAATVRCFRVC